MLDSLTFVKSVTTILGKPVRKAVIIYIKHHGEAIPE